MMGPVIDQNQLIGFLPYKANRNIVHLDIRVPWHPLRASCMYLSPKPHNLNKTHHAHPTHILKTHAPHNSKYISINLFNQLLCGLFTLINISIQVQTPTFLSSSPPLSSIFNKKQPNHVLDSLQIRRRKQAQFHFTSDTRQISLLLLFVCFYF